MSEVNWQNQAECQRADPELFFVGDTSARSENYATQEAKELCNVCIVAAECLAYALKNDDRSGIWGGHTTDERMQLKRRARRIASSGV